MKPALIVDVDGVLNPFRGEQEELAAVGYIWSAEANTWYKPDHGRLLLDFAATHGFELIWGTYWEELANLQLAPLLGIDESWPVIKVWDETGEFYPTWKYGPVQVYCWERPLAWLDDGFGYEDQRNHIQFIQERRAPTKLVHVDPAEGLLQTHLDEIADWKAQLCSDKS